VEVKLNIFGQRHLYVVYRHAKVSAALFRDAATPAHLGYSVTHGTQTWEDEDIMCLWQNFYALQELNPDPPSSSHILYLLL
jgi:hypothetical protein